MATRDKIIETGKLVGACVAIVAGLSGGVVWSVDKFLRPVWAADINTEVKKRFDSINRDLTSQSNAIREQGFADARTEAELKALRDAIEQQNRLLEALIKRK